MGGLAAEYVVCGDEVGGSGDIAKLIELVQLHRLADGVSSEDWLITSTRTAMQMVQNHRVEFDAAVERMEAGAGVDVCVAAVEKATTVPWFDSVSRHYPHVRGRD